MHPDYSNPHQTHIALLMQSRERIEEQAEMSKALAPFLAVILVCGLAWHTATSWATLTSPYKWVAAYYYYLIVKPLSWFGNVWTYLTSPGLTAHPNLNLIIAIVGTIGYGMFLLTVVASLAAIFRGKFIALSVGPLAGALLWLGMSSAYGWMFSKEPSWNEGLKHAAKQWAEEDKQYMEYFQAHKREVCLKERASFDKHWPASVVLTPKAIEAKAAQHDWVVKRLGPQFDTGCLY